MQWTGIDDRYDVSEPLGSGGMATVYLARDRVLGRDVALKVLREQYAENREFVERFRREAQNAASLSHPNIVPVYDRGETDDGVYYIAMEYLPGGTLKERITREGKLEPEVAAGVTYQVSDALQEAHERGVIHRDIKSQNIFLTESGDVKVGDFGIARAASATATFGTSMILGTASYMAPEQALGEPATPRSDLYSLGIVLYEMLTGKLPYMADSPVAVSLKHVKDPPKLPGETEPTTPQEMNVIVATLLAKDPDARYGSAAALMDDLERMRDGLPLAAAAPDEPTVAMRRAGRRKRSRRPILAVAAVAALSLLGAGAWEFSRSPANQAPEIQVQEVANSAPAPLPEAPERPAANEARAPEDQASGDQTPEDAPTVDEAFDLPDTPPEDQSTAPATASASASASAASASAFASPSAPASSSATASASATAFASASSAPTPTPTPRSSATPAPEATQPVQPQPQSAQPQPRPTQPAKPQPQPAEPQPQPTRPAEPVRPEVPAFPDIPLPGDDD